ncbi:MAG: transglycosylase domain-containing protein, partial [Gammaproteobacteria bacterium]
MRPLYKFLSFILAGAFGIFTLGIIILGGAYITLAPQLPSIDSLRDVRLQVPLRVYTRNGGLIGEFGEMRRIPIKISEAPKALIQAVLAAEDDRFYTHPGVDYHGILRASIHLLRTGEKRQGGSTITMQVARNFFLNNEKTYARKLKEILLALKIERELDKNT